MIKRSKSKNYMGTMDCPVWAIINPNSRGEYAVQCLWFTEEEAKSHLELNRNNYSLRAYVFGLPARGELKTILGEHTEE
jgi:hypothetical protein